MTGKTKKKDNDVKKSKKEKKESIKMQRSKDWQEVRKQGKWKFVRNYGIFGWGIQTFVIFWILFHLLEHGFKFSDWLVERWVFVYSSWLLIFMIAGGLWGLVMWIYSERKYSKSE